MTHDPPCKSGCHHCNPTAETGRPKLTDEEIQDTIARWAIGEEFRRADFRDRVRRIFGDRGLKILREMWQKRFLAVDGYREVKVTRRWADYENEKRYPK